MQALFCKHCGSENHQSGDCSKKHLTYTGPAPTVQFDKTALQLHDEAHPDEPKAAKEKTTIALLSPPRWPGGPPTCNAANLPKFDTEKEANAFIGTNCPGSHAVPKPCDKCGGYHLQHPQTDPVRNETGWRQSKRPFLRDSTRREMDARSARPTLVRDDPVQELPKREVAPVEKRVELPRSPKLKQRAAGDLF